LIKQFKKQKYIEDIIKKYPKVVSGRKNFKKHHDRIKKTLEIIKNFNKTSN
tara:strand:+ start:1061 stop:1213 length:153 start_codon:yes stop_codon:yes gene_type:complete